MRAAAAGTEVGARRRSRRRKIAARAVALLLGTVLALGIAELGLRIVDYPGAQERRARRFHPRYGTVNADSWIFDFRIDPARHRAVDLRGQLIPLAKPEGEQRVLFLGDSATEGAFVSIAESYPLRFQQLLSTRDPRTRVRAINAGVWGMTTIDEYHLLRDKLLPLRPDVVVLGLFLANDINFNLGHRQQRLHHVAPSWVEAARQRSALVHFLFLQALAINQRHRLVESDDLGSVWSDARIGLVDEYGFHMLSYPAGEVALYMRRPSRLVHEAFRVLEAALAQLRDLGAQRGFSLRVLMIPTPSAVLGRLAVLHHPNILAELRAQGVRVRETDLDFALPARRVLDICRELELTCVDATAELARLGRAAFFPTDEHPTAAGHDALARALLHRAGLAAP
jgi:lysophospholipase L1-like esterase